MWFIVIFLVVSTHADSKENVLKVQVNRNSSNACHLLPGKLVEGKSAYIDFCTDEIFSIQNYAQCLDTIGENKFKLTSKSHDYTECKRYKITELNDWVRRTWKCDLLYELPCILDIQFRNKHLPKMMINGKDIQIYRAESQMYDALGTYYFNENQIVAMRCSSKDEGALRFTVADQEVTGYIENISYITLMMKITKEMDNKYVDCVLDKNGLVSNIRTALKLRGHEEDPDSWKVEINKHAVLPSEGSIDYHFIEGEYVLISCQKINGDYNWGSFVEVRHDINNLPSIRCPKRDDGYFAKIHLHPMETRGLKGLVSENVKFLYKDNINRLVIHYEYEVNDNISMSWAVTVKGFYYRNYTVYLKDKLIQSQILKEGSYEIKVPDFNLTHEDDGAEMKFGWTASYGKTNEVIMIKLRLKEVGQSDVTSEFNLVFIIGIAVSSIILVAILTAMTLLIRKNKAHKTTSSNGNYGNLLNEESSTSPFPPQWDSYAHNLETNNHVYDQPRIGLPPPIPGSLSNGRQPDTTRKYSVPGKHRGSSATYENPFYEKHNDDIYSYVQPNYNGEEHFYCEIDK